MSNNLRTRNGLPFNFVNGIKVRGMDIESLIPGIEGIPEAGSKYQFAGNGSNKVFTLPVTPYNKDAVDVYVKQLYVHPDDYTLVGDTITLTEAPPAVVAGETYNVVVKVSLTTLNGYVNASRVSFEGENLDDILEKSKPIANYAALRAYAGAATQVRITDPGIAGFFYYDASDTTSNDNGGTVIVAGNGKRWRRIYEGGVNIKWFGAVGDGVTNDAVAIQKGIDCLGSAGGVVYFPAGTYRVARNIGINDRWGIKISTSNILIRGHNAKLRRYDTNISTYALAYPILFVGVPDSNAAAAVENVTIEGFTFVGENTQHSISGSAPNDFRDAIHAKNTKNLKIQANTFVAIDSAVITYQKPSAYEHVNGTYYNTTKNYNSKFINNTCLATPHTVVGRALIHAVTALGIDNLLIEGNHFEWCDNAVASDTTYDIDKTETDAFTPTVTGWTLGAVNRTGRGVVINGNVFHNCSEHPIYLSGFEEVVTGNKITSDTPSITATNDAIKIRSYGCTVSGNVVTGYGSGISCASGAINVSVSGNAIHVPGSANFGVGAIGVSSQSLSAYVAPRIAVGYWSTYRPMSGITISGNTIQFPAAAQSPDNTRRQQAFTLLSDNSDSNYAQGQIRGVTIVGNTITNYQVGVQITGTLCKNVRITGNSFIGKTFTESGFSTSTLMNTRAVIQMLRDSNDQLKEISFTSNSVYGTKYLCASFDSGGSAGTIQMPRGFSDNSLKFVQYIATSDFASVESRTKFQNNTGVYFLDRLFGSTGLNNTLFIDDGTSALSGLKNNFTYSSGAVRFYTDDVGTFLTL